MHVGRVGLDVAAVDAKVVGQLGRGRRATQRGGQGLGGLVHPAGLGAHRAARPVAAAQLVEQRAADAARGVAVEADPAVRVEAAGGLRQPGHAGRHEVVAADVLRQSGRHVGDRVLDEREMFTDKLALHWQLQFRLTHSCRACG